MVLGAAAIGWAAASLLHRGPSVTAPPGEAKHAVQPQVEAALLPRAPESPRVTQVSPPPAVSASQQSRPLAPSPPPVAESEVEPPSDEERRIYADGVFDSESFDSAWASGAAQHLRDVASSLGVPRVHLLRVDCRTTLCRVVFDAARGSADTRAVKTFVQQARWEGSGMAVKGEPDARGDRSVTIFLTRGRAPLPEPPIDPPSAPSSP